MHLKLLIQQCRLFHLVTSIEMYSRKFMRTALTLAVDAQGEFRLLRFLPLATGVFQYWAAVVSCVCKLILLFYVVFYLIIIVT